jgi:hypothetical protein
VLINHHRQDGVDLCTIGCLEWEGTWRAVKQDQRSREVEFEVWDKDQGCFPASSFLQLFLKLMNWGYMESLNTV